MNSMKNCDEVRPFLMSHLFSKMMNALMNMSALSIARAASTKASVYLTLGSLAMLGFIMSFAAVAFIATVFGICISGLIGAIGAVILAVSIIVSVAAILITGSIFVPGGFVLVAGFFCMIVFSTVIAIIDILPACSLIAFAFLVLTLLAIFV
ncbi:uncharacterized protein LOC131673722 [Phymastichus coffea]|uniref:uncharacterized protein LOC131673722 n=1 Tax=Phymastichus coffea TaxID=108790 RepID=UPI00273C336F|nr:uncharacterized protein LOC131673722 [Phymastichus coffea]